MPKQSNAPDISPANMNFLFSVLKNCEEIKPDWDKVAEDNGIAYARNASSRFATIMKSLGYRYEKGKIMDTGPANNNNNSAPKTPTKKHAQTQAPGSSAKKRKVEVVKSEVVKSESEGDTVADSKDE